MFEESKTTERIQHLFDGYIAPCNSVTPGNIYTASASEFNGRYGK